MENAERSRMQLVEEWRHVRPGDADDPGANVFIDSMTLINRSYVYEFASEAYCRAHGRSREEIVGNSVASVWGESHFHNLIKKQLDACFAGNIVRYENWLELPMLGRRCYRVSYSPYFHDNGETTHAVVAALDITDVKKEEEALEKSEPHFRTVLKAMHYGVYIFDSEGRFAFVNDVVVKNSGYPREWYLGKSLFDLARTEERETLRNHFAAVVRGERVPPYEFAYRKATNDLGMGPYQRDSHQGGRPGRGGPCSPFGRHEAEAVRASAQGKRREIQEAFRRLQGCDVHYKQAGKTHRRKPRVPAPLRVYAGGGEGAERRRYICQPGRL